MPSQRLGPLRLCHINAQSMINKTDEIQHFLTTRSIYVCSINETWLHPSKTFNLRNYQIFRRHKRGGVCFLVHNSFLCEQLIFPFSQTEEILAIRLHGVSKDKQDIVVATSSHLHEPAPITSRPTPQSAHRRRPERPPPPLGQPTKLPKRRSDRTANAGRGPRPP